MRGDIEIQAALQQLVAGAVILNAVDCIVEVPRSPSQERLVQPQIALRDRIREVRHDQTQLLVVSPGEGDELLMAAVPLPRRLRVDLTPQAVVKDLIPEGLEQLRIEAIHGPVGILEGSAEKLDWQPYSPPLELAVMNQPHAGQG